MNICWKWFCHNWYQMLKLTWNLHVIDEKKDTVLILKQFFFGGKLWKNVEFIFENVFTKKCLKYEYLKNKNKRKIIGLNITVYTF